MENHATLRQIAEVFMADETDYLLLSDAIKRYDALLLELSGIDLQEEALREDIHFSNGKALGTTWAALCVQDMVRTKRFVQGIFEAIKDLKRRDVHPIHLVYAGSGPFATLILPILAIYAEEDIQVTLIEINQRSYESVKRVLRRLNFTGFVKDILNEDATTYQFEDGAEVHIVVSETMQSALKAEQQVPIMMNLLPQFQNDVIFIPEKIVLSVGGSKLNNRENDGVGNTVAQQIAQVFELNKEQISAVKIDHPEEVQFPKITVELPKSFIRKYGQIAILTEIQIYKDTWISFNESGLTTPIVVEDLSAADPQNLLVTFQYKISANPQLEVRLWPSDLAKVDQK